MRELYLINVTLHVLAAMLWLGGMLFLAAVGAPVLRGVEPAALRAQLFGRLGKAFRAAGWGAIGVLLVTGVINLHFIGVLWDGRLGEAAFWRSSYGTTLAWKLSAVAIMMTISFLHDFILGPRAAHLMPGTPEALRARTRSAWLARVNAMVGILLVCAAVRLARGG